MPKTFSGGVHPPEFKHLTSDKPFEQFPLSKQLVCVMSQHIGAPAKPVVKKKDTVKRGQVIGESTGFVSLDIHAPTSGVVKAVEEVTHPLGKKSQAVIIEPDGEDSWVDGLLTKRTNINKIDARELVNIIQSAGIAGLGGATFPSHVKLSPPPDKKIDTLVLNGAECEPYLTCDYRLMLDFTEEIIKGAEILQKILGVKSVHIGIEANKKDAFYKMRELAEQYEDVFVHLLHVKYPQGGEKQLIKAILNRDVPAGGLPMDVGVVCHNVMTTYYVYRAVHFGEPLTERYMTVSGDGIEKPANLCVRIGTPIADILDYVGVKEEGQKLIMGGPMMGIAQHSVNIPVIKGTSGLLVLQDPGAMDFENCIRCGACVDHCPMKLVPSELSIYLEKGRVDLAKNYNLADCMECGVCAYVCPAKRPIVQFIKFGKAQVMRERANKKN